MPFVPVESLGNKSSSSLSVVSIDLPVEWAPRTPLEPHSR